MDRPSSFTASCDGAAAGATLDQQTLAMRSLIRAIVHGLGQDAAAADILQAPT